MYIFSTPTILFGHIISVAGVSTDRAKISAIQSWPQPTTIKDLRSFLGLTGYYRKFVRHFIVIAKPLTNLLKKQVLFAWTHEYTNAFNALKLALLSSLVLAMPDFSKIFFLETDTSNGGVGVVLLLEGHPLAFISNPLGPRRQGLSTYEKEYLAILIAVEYWRYYLQLNLEYALIRRFKFILMSRDRTLLRSRRCSPS
jgi:hypothetical protein